VEELGREEVTFIARIYFEKLLNLFQRAAERYVDVTPEELERRRRRGWGEGIADVRVPLHISFLTISYAIRLRIFLKTAPQQQGLRLPPRLCNYALILTPYLSHQPSQMNSSNMIRRSP
jgi:hypothetical protein